MTSTRLFLLMTLAMLLVYGAMASVALRVYQAERQPATVTQTAAVHGVKCTRGEEWPRCYGTTNGVPDHDRN